MEASYHENYSKQLQRLLSTVTKSQKKYKKAAEQVETQEFKDLFTNYADQRANIAGELKEAVQTYGGNVEHNADTEEAFHSSHSDQVDSKKDQSVLETLRKSERETLDTYDDVLQGSILEEFNLKTLIMGQRLIINENFSDLDRRYFELFKLSQPY